jgi:hypothetical protein
MLEISDAVPYDRTPKVLNHKCGPNKKYIQLPPLLAHYIDELVDAPCENNHLSPLAVIGNM